MERPSWMALFGVGARAVERDLDETRRFARTATGDDFGPRPDVEQLHQSLHGRSIKAAQRLCNRFAHRTENGRPQIDFGAALLELRDSAAVAVAAVHQLTRNPQQDALAEPSRRGLDGC